MSDFLVPDLGEGLEDATITSWAVAVGDVVELNQTLCTVETNKAEVEIPSPYTGRIAELGGAEGETLAVGTLLVRIETEDRAPVLVGYGIDDGMDRSRRARAAPLRRASCRRPCRGSQRVGARFGNRWRHHPRRRARRGRHGIVTEHPGAWRARPDGHPHVVVAQPNSGCTRQRAGRWHGAGATS